MKDEFKIFLNNLKDTEKLAKKIANVIVPKSLILIRGKLGVGKTTLVKYIINSMSKTKLIVSSPTFPIVNTYDLKRIRVWHYDLYRLKNKNDIHELDFEVALMDCVIIEWPEIIEDLLPNKRIDILLDEDATLKRFAKVFQIGEKSMRLKLKL